MLRVGKMVLKNLLQHVGSTTRVYHHSDVHPPAVLHEIRHQCHGFLGLFNLPTGTPSISLLLQCKPFQATTHLHERNCSVHNRTHLVLAVLEQRRRKQLGNLVLALVGFRELHQIEDCFVHISHHSTLCLSLGVTPLSSIEMGDVVHRVQVGMNEADTCTPRARVMRRHSRYPNNIRS